jgi:hypothetical protein
VPFDDRTESTGLHSRRQSPRRRITIPLSLIAVSLLGASSAWADEPPGQIAAPDASATPSPSRFGLYLDARLGLGILAVGDSVGYAGITDAGLPLALAAGTNLARDLVLFGELSVVDMLLALDVYGAGLGLKYYLTPERLFVSASGSMARIHYGGAANISETSRWGVVTRLAVGKEWPISPSWSLGVAGELQLGEVGQPYHPASSPGSKYTTGGLSGLALASYRPATARGPGAASPTDAMAPPPAGYHRHDGLYLNLSFGAGWLRARNRRWDALYAAPDEEWKGRGLPWALSLGYAFANRLVVFGEVAQMQVQDPVDQDYLARLKWQGLGLGLRYYLMPINVFLAASLLGSTYAMYSANYTDDIYGARRTSEWGATGLFSLGKEWWIASDLGVGLAAEVGMGRMEGTDGWLTYKIQMFSLLASVTFN